MIAFKALAASSEGLFSTVNESAAAGFSAFAADFFDSPPVRARTSLSSPMFDTLAASYAFRYPRMFLIEFMFESCLAFSMFDHASSVRTACWTCTMSRICWIP